MISNNCVYCRQKKKNMGKIGVKKVCADCMLELKNLIPA